MSANRQYAAKSKASFSFMGSGRNRVSGAVGSPSGVDVAAWSSCEGSSISNEAKAFGRPSADEPSTDSVGGSVEFKSLIVVSGGNLGFKAASTPSST